MSSSCSGFTWLSHTGRQACIWGNVHEYLSPLQCVASPLFSTFILDFITGLCLSFPPKCTSSPNSVTPRHIFLCASPSVNLHRNPNRTVGSLGVQKLPECHCIINGFDNNTFIFILVSFSWDPYCGDFCQIVNSSGCVGFLQDSSHSLKNMHIRVIGVCVCVCGVCLRACTCYIQTTKTLILLAKWGFSSLSKHVFEGGIRSNYG